MPASGGSGALGFTFDRIAPWAAPSAMIPVLTNPATASVLSCAVALGSFSVFHASGACLIAAWVMSTANAPETARCVACSKSAASLASAVTPPSPAVNTPPGEVVMVFHRLANWS